MTTSESFMTRRRLLAAMAAGMSTTGVPFASAQSGWPSKSIHIFVGYAAGGPTDSVARVFGNRLGSDLGQQIVVENKPGAGGTLAAAAVAKAAPDGYSLLVGEPGSMAINAAEMPQLSYHPVRDFAAIAQVVSLPIIVVASPLLRVKDLKGLLALGKTKPLAFGTPGSGTMQHLTMLEFGKVNGVEFTHVAYRGGGPAIVDVLGGQLPLAMVTIPSVLPYVKSGQLVALGLVAAQRSALLPDVPTFSESGYPGFVQDGWQGFFAPAGTPPHVLAKLSAAILKAGKSPEVESALTTSGALVVLAGPSDFAATVERDVAYWAKIVANNPSAR